MNRKGIYLTLDANLALIVAAALLIGSVYMVYSPPNISWRTVYLARLSTDFLTLMEKEDVLAATVATEDTSDLLIALNTYLPESVCAVARLRVYDKSLDEIKEIAVGKSGCERPKEKNIAKRSFVVVGDDATLNYGKKVTYFGVAQLETWYK